MYIRSDSRAKYEKVVDVVDNLRAAGVDQVGLLTEQIPKKGAAAAPLSNAPARWPKQGSGGIGIKKEYLWRWQWVGRQWPNLTST